MFEAEVHRIAGALGNIPIQYEHIGSTAVAGLRAKPIIDILIGVRSLVDADTCIQPMMALDYEYVKRYENRLPQRRFFRRRVDGATRFQVHMVEHGGPFWHEHLLFREALRNFDDLRDRYERLKTELAEQYRDQREAYADAKGEFVSEVLQIARSRGLSA